ncbi:aconitate hydratase AcnA [Bacillus thuringiensis]|nr:aconitate hydratase AcnA [Bacillus thuringiensis]
MKKISTVLKDLKTEMKVDDDYYTIFDLNKLSEHLSIDMSKMPYTIKILFESLVRNASLGKISLEDFDTIIESLIKNRITEIPFFSSRVLMEDNAGLPLLLDLATMRDVIKSNGGNPEDITASVPASLIIDHSIQANHFGSNDALNLNLTSDFKRNYERYNFLKWSHNAFDSLNVLPPNSGISHQINLEHLSNVIHIDTIGGEKLIFPESFIGSDSHTPMINSLGILGWGAGGIEVEASVLGEPTMILTPEILGIEITGEINPGVTITDIVLKLTELLRKKNVVGRYLEFFGKGIRHLTLPDRATISNMAPEYGAKSALFPIDEETLEYLYTTGRSRKLLKIIEIYFKTQGFYRENVFEEVKYTQKIEFNLSNVVPCVSGPRRPQDFIPLDEIKPTIIKELTEEGTMKIKEDFVPSDSQTIKITDGSVVIAAITSCTNTSNPINMISAGLLAKKAVEFGLEIPGYVKTSFAPGSKVVYQYLKQAKLMQYLERMRFNVVGFGCSTCAGSGGDIDPKIQQTIVESDLKVCSILSGNRNFSGRIHPDVKLNYLASPALVIAYAIAGTMNFDLYNEPLGQNEKGESIYLRDIWPSEIEIKKVLKEVLTPEIFIKEYEHINNRNIYWDQLDVHEGKNYKWSEDSTYLKPSPFCELEPSTSELNSRIANARALVLLGDNVTTDDISPGGQITKDSIAGEYLLQQGVSFKDFNTYGTRRGNHEVMVRGTFYHNHIENKILDNVKGSFTKYFPTEETMSIFEASRKYKDDNTPLLIIAGKEYGTGSSRDWAAKGPYLLGVRAVLAESFEGIHRSNLINVGILPLQFCDGESWHKLNLKGDEIFTIHGIDTLDVRKDLSIEVSRNSGEIFFFNVIAQIDSKKEFEYYKNGGILKYLIREKLSERIPTPLS